MNIKKLYLKVSHLSFLVWVDRFGKSIAWKLYRYEGEIK